jgi:RimJ/RimL family protein N-acetyltransferase
MNQFRSRVADDYSPRTMEEYVEIQNRRMHPGLNWGVYRDDDLGGAIWFEPSSPIAGIIHTVFRKDFWGHETTYPALRAAGEAIFNSGTRKLLAMCFADNHSVRGMAKRFGMQQEAHFHGMTVRGGVPVDMVAFGLTKEEYYGNRNRDGAADLVIGERRSRDRQRAVGEEANADHGHDAEARPVAATAAE